jgi:hypothetical protein
MGSKCVVTLVHGTWAPNAPWTDGTSAFCEEINKQLDGAVEFHPFNWSGGNSHDDRLLAARSLASELRTRCADMPDAKHFVVAHSHGGNVALYALRDVELQRGMTGLICLATPFISIEARNLARALTPFAILFIGLTGILLSVLYLSVAATIVVVPILLFKYSGNSGWWGALIGLLILAPAFYWFNRWFTPRWRIAVDAVLNPVKGLRRRLRARQRRLLLALAVPDHIVTPIYTVRNETDEAYLGLTAVHGLSDLPYRTFEFFERVQNAAFEMWFSFGVGIMLLRLGLEWLFGWNSRALILEALVLFVIGSIACLLLMPVFNGIRFHRLGFGEPLGLGLLLKISVRNTPPCKQDRINRVGDGVVRINKDPQRGTIMVSRTIQRPLFRTLLHDRRLLHSAIYSDPEVISGIALWMRTMCA